MIRRSVYGWFNRHALRHAKEAFADPKRAQRNALESILHTHASCAYAQHHKITPKMGFGQFRRTLPIVGYEDLRPWINPLVEHGSGAANTVVSTDVSMFLKTSGTTGPSKHLPVTAQYAHQTHIGRTFWIERMLAEDDMNGDGTHMTVVSPMHEGHTPGGLPYGSNTGRIFYNQPELVKLWSPVPYCVFSVRDFDLRYYLILRFAVGKTDLGTITTANPSTVLLLCRKLVEHGEEIAQDLEAGRICSPTRTAHLDAIGFGAFLDRATSMKTLTERSKPQPRVAKRLRDALREGPEGLLARIWPKITTVNSWLGGHAPFYLGKIKPFLAREGKPPLAMRDPGFSASEGLFGIPTQSGTPEGVLHVGGHVLEFIPEGEDPRGKTLLAHELESGKHYRIIVTTGGGLWRYDMNDIVEAVGTYDATPTVRFLYKAGGTLSITGEKVTEAHAIRVASSLGGERPLEGVCATLGLEDPPRYLVAVEHSKGDDRALHPKRAEVLAKRWDTSMSQANAEYAEKRASGRLAAPRAQVIPEGSFAAWRRKRVDAGAPDGQVKLPPLVKTQEVWERDLVHVLQPTKDTPHD